MSAKINVAILMGGPSLEHEVSLSSGITVIKNLNADKYNTIPIVVGKNSAWYICEPEKFKNIHPAELKKWICYTEELSLSDAINELKKKNIDVCFIAMHGSYGEDGTIQAVLNAHNIRYTGSGMLASSIAMDKIVYKRILLSAGVNTPDTVFVFPDKIEDEIELIQQVSGRIGFPCVIKTPSSGSSIGVELCSSKNSFSDIINRLFPIDNRLLIEKYVNGREFTCAVIGNSYSKDIKALPPTEIITKNAFFDFEAKYTPGAAQEITPAQISADLTSRISQTAIRVHNTIGCAGMSRTDMIVDTDGQIFVLETNTIPGMTDQSLLPQAAIAEGLSICELLDKIISCAMDEHSRKPRSALSKCNKE